MFISNGLLRRDLPYAVNQNQPEMVSDGQDGDGCALSCVVGRCGVAVHFLASFCCDDRPFAQLVGISLLVIYMVADSFTSTWQSKIFSDHEVCHSEEHALSSLLDLPSAQLQYPCFSM